MAYAKATGCASRLSATQPASPADGKQTHLHFAPNQIPLRLNPTTNCSVTIVVLFVTTSLYTYLVFANFLSCEKIIFIPTTLIVTCFSNYQGSPRLHTGPGAQSSPTPMQYQQYTQRYSSPARPHAPYSHHQVNGLIFRSVTLIYSYLYDQYRGM